MPHIPQLKQAPESGSDAPTCSLSSSADTPIMNAAMGWHDRRDLLAQIGLLERDVAAWKANHDNQVAIKRIIAARPDLKYRAPMVEKLMSERNRAQGRSTLQHERIKRLESAIRETIMENLHLADGDVCTLKRLKDAIGFELSSENAEAMARPDQSRPTETP